MNYGPLLFLGILFTLASSWFGLVLVPSKQLGSQLPNRTTNDVGVVSVYPQSRNGQAQQGAELYRSLGCVTCHSQQVRPEGFGADVARGWGKRRSVSRDYLYESPVQLGESRIGPDLANFGERLPAADVLFAHLYNPQIVAKGSVMPPYPFLFEKRHIGAGAGSTNALKLAGEFAVEAGFEVVPRLEARQLVEYLRSLKTSVDLPEAHLPKKEAADDANAKAAK